MDKYEQDMDVWGNKYTILYVNGKCGKALPPKPPHPFEGRKGKHQPPPVITHSPFPEPVSHPHCAAAPTHALVDTVDYEDDSEYADTDTDNNS